MHFLLTKNIITVFANMFLHDAACYAHCAGHFVKFHINVPSYCIVIHLISSRLKTKTTRQQKRERLNSSTNLLYEGYHFIRMVLMHINGKQFFQLLWSTLQNQ